MQYPTHGPNGNPIFYLGEDDDKLKRIKDHAGDGWQWEYEGKLYRYPYYIIRKGIVVASVPDGRTDCPYEDLIYSIEPGGCMVTKQYAYHYKSKPLDDGEELFDEADKKEPFQTAPDYSKRNSQVVYPVLFQ